MKIIYVFFTVLFLCLPFHSHGQEWQARLDKAFEHTSRPYPNWRLPESNIILISLLLKKSGEENYY